MTQKKQKYIVRCDKAGVFYGEIKSRNGAEVTMANVRKVWHWEGAFAVEDLAVNGTARPKSCSITVTLEEMTVLGVCQILPCTEKAMTSLDGVKEWKYAD